MGVYAGAVCSLHMCNISNFSVTGNHPNDNRVQVLEMFGADIGLTTKQVLQIMAEADNNDDGVIEYKECESPKGSRA